MMKRVVLALSATAAACGSVSQSSSHDAPPASDAAAGDAAAGDAAVADAPPATPRTAIAAGGNAAFTAPSMTPVRVPYGSVSYDDQHEFSTALSRFTATRAGDYQVCASLGIGAVVAFELDLYVNGLPSKAFAFGGVAANGCASVRLRPQDFVEVWVIQEAASAVNVPVQPFSAWLTIQEEPALVAAVARAGFTASSGQFTRVPYATETFDTRGEFDPVTSQFTASQAGDYQVCASLSASVEFELDLFKNGARERLLGEGPSAAGGCRVLRLAAGDQVHVEMMQSSGAAVNVALSAVWDWLTIRQVHGDLSVGAATAFTTQASAFVAVPYASELYDDHDRFNPATHRYTVGASGDYEVCAAIGNPSLPGALEIDLFRSGVHDKTLSLRGLAPAGCRVVRATAAEVLDVEAFTNSTSNFTVASDDSWNALTVRPIP